MKSKLYIYKWLNDKRKHWIIANSKTTKQMDVAQRQKLKVNEIP